MQLKLYQLTQIKNTKKTKKFALPHFLIFDINPPDETSTMLNITEHYILMARMSRDSPHLNFVLKVNGQPLHIIISIIQHKKTVQSTEGEDS